MLHNDQYGLYIYPGIIHESFQSQHTDLHCDLFISRSKLSEVPHTPDWPLCVHEILKVKLNYTIDYIYKSRKITHRAAFGAQISDTYDIWKG